MGRSVTEIGGLHSVGINDIQECGNGKKNGDLPIFFFQENCCENRGEQVIEQAPENAAQAIPYRLPRKFFDSAQRMNFKTNVIVLQRFFPFLYLS